MTERYPIFSLWMDQYGFIREHKFDKNRKWKMDYANLGLLICVEVEGGVWQMGRHTRGSGFVKDMEKYNTATIAGWAVLRVTPQMIQDGTAYQLVELALTNLDPTKEAI